MAGIRRKSPDIIRNIKEFVDDYYFEHHNSPTLQKIADGVGISKATVYRYLLDMDKKGMLSYDGKAIQTKAMTKSDYALTRVPVLGNVVCGSPEFSEEDFEEFVALPVALFGQGDFFILRTHGNSMIEAGIDEGDMVVVKKQNYADYGDMVVALIDNETTLKTYYPEPEKKRIRLHPENRDMKDIVVRECIIQGVAKHVIKKL